MLFDLHAGFSCMQRSSTGAANYVCLPCLLLCSDRAHTVRRADRQGGALVDVLRR